MYVLSSANETDAIQQASADLLAHGTSKDAWFFLRQYTLPIIGLFAVIGNSFSVAIFLSSKHRRSSCSLYLAAKSITDTGFIVTLFIAWLDFLDIRIFHLDGICQMTVFISYICSFWSVSLVVCITFENYIRICKPMLVTTLCTPKIAQCTMLVLFGVGSVMYSLPLWGLRVQIYGGKKYCLTLNRFKTLELALTYTDTCLTLMLPLLIIILLLLLIFCNSIEASKRRMRLNQVPEERNQSYQRPHSVVTRLLSSVSIVFLVLHTPSHVIRIKVIIEKFIGDVPEATDTDRKLQYIFLTMYYLNYSVNFFIYIFCGKQFRQMFLNTFCKYCKCDCTCHDHEESHDYERFSGAFFVADVLDKNTEETRL